MFTVLSVPVFHLWCLQASFWIHKPALTLTSWDLKSYKNCTETFHTISRRGSCSLSCWTVFRFFSVFYSRKRLCCSCRGTVSCRSRSWLCTGSSCEQVRTNRASSPESETSSKRTPASRRPTWCTSSICTDGDRGSWSSWRTSTPNSWAPSPNPKTRADLRPAPRDPGADPWSAPQDPEQYLQISVRDLIMTNVLILDAAFTSSRKTDLLNRWIQSESRLKYN